MGLNIVKKGSQMYQWLNATWNPVKGECLHGCTYCYMKRWGKQKSIRLDESEFDTDLGVNNRIFIGSSCDLFAKDIPSEWILRVMQYAGRFQNRYLYQTKNPIRLYCLRHLLSDFDAVCTTIETNRHYSQMAFAPSTQERAHWLSMFPFNRYLTIEPIMDFDLTAMVDLIHKANPVQVNIGADSGNNHLPEPSKDKVLALIEELQKFTVIDRKTNLQRLMK